MSGINLIVGCEVNAYNCESVRARCPGLIVAGGMQGMHFSVNEQCRLFSVLCIGADLEHGDGSTLFYNDIAICSAYDSSLLLLNIRLRKVEADADADAA
jgi:hypothetical protein